MAAQHRIIKKLATNKIGRGRFGAGKALDHEWAVASVGFADLAHGHVIAFVAGASAKDVFRRFELARLIANLALIVLMGLVASIWQKSPQRKMVSIGAYRVIALAIVREEMKQALRTGDKELIKGALEQKILYESQRRTDKGHKIESVVEFAQKKSGAIDTRVNRLSTSRQITIRAEALNEVEFMLRVASKAALSRRNRPN